MKKLSTEEKIYNQQIQWDNNIVRFCNSLLLNRYDWKQVSQKIVEHQLLKHEYTKFDRRSNSTVEHHMIPSPQQFREALRNCGVPEEYMDERVRVDYVTTLNILERARQLELHPKYVKWMDKHTTIE